MSQKQRYLVTYKSLDPKEAKTMTFGIKAKKYAQAISQTKVYIYSKELHNSKDYGYDLTAEPSHKPADYEIPDENQIVYMDDYDNFNEVA